MQKLILAAIAGTALSACTLAPHYERPSAPVAATWSEGEAATAATGAAADIGWRDFFADPQLQQLIERALVNNRDLRIATLNVEAARAQYRIQRAELLPAIDASGAGSSQRVAETLSQNGESYVARSYSAGVGITAYELDLFGRIRSLKRAALERYLGDAETRRSAQISLVAELANAYLSLLADQALLQMTQDTLSNQQASYELSRQRFEAGAASGLDLRQAQTALETARAELARYRRQVELDRNALGVLVGGPLGTLAPPAEAFVQRDFLLELPAGLPSEVLTQRPDVLAAEHRLLAANANIGAARAAFFPRITLTGSLGTASNELSGLFEDGARTWSFVPQITLPIFSGGANLANLDRARVQKDIDIAQYEKAIQTAFREVADGLAARGTYEEQVQAQAQLLEATAEAYRLAQLRFENGIESYLAVLDAQRSLYGAQQAYVNVKLQRLQNLVSLYKSLGGGWKEYRPAPPLAAPR